MTLLGKQDRIANLKERLNNSDSERLSKLTQKEVVEIVNKYEDLMYDFFIDSHEHGLDYVGLGRIGKVKIVIRPPSPYYDVHKKEHLTSGHTPLYYFKPSERLRDEGKRAVREHIRNNE